jgi:hypothetical protein
MRIRRDALGPCTATHAELCWACYSLDPVVHLVRFSSLRHCPSASTGLFREFHVVAWFQGTVRPCQYVGKETNGKLESLSNSGLGVKGCSEVNTLFKVVNPSRASSSRVLL